MLSQCNAQMKISSSGLIFVQYKSINIIIIIIIINYYLMQNIFEKWAGLGLPSKNGQDGVI